MSGDPPAGAQVSADGKWWWDGARWIPMPGGQMVAQPQEASPMQPVAGPYVYGARTNSLAVASLVSGILAWVVCPVVGGILAIVFGHLARNQIRLTGEAGGGMAMAGLILGYVHLGISALVIILWIVGFAAFVAVIGHVPIPTPTP